MHRTSRRRSSLAVVAGILAVALATLAAMLLLDPPGETDEVTETPPSEPAAAPGEAPLPALLGAIGDSLTKAAAAHGQPGDAPQHSWVVGTDPGDGAVSHLQRLRQLGADPRVVDAAISGGRMASAPDQARAVARVAAGLGDGEIAYVTFQLGANDLCGASLQDATEPDRYESLGREALDILRDGLPAGSVLLVLSVPDAPRLAEIYPDGSTAREVHRQYGICPVALGGDADRDAARERIREYNRILIRLCEEVTGSGLDCRHDQAGDPVSSLFGAPFQEGEVSALDFFHPSMEGQARIAEETWPLTPWAGR